MRGPPPPRLYFTRALAEFRAVLRFHPTGEIPR
jgi:hypothetical protein